MNMRPPRIEEGGNGESRQVEGRSVISRVSFSGRCGVEKEKEDQKR